MKNGKVLIWMNLLGFHRDDADRGVERFLDRTGFVPDGVCALMCNSDFFHQHRGMGEEYTLPPDNCAYWGVPRNAERERQPWTNYNLRELTHNLAAKGCNTYASIFGNYLGSAFHREWIEDHPEIRRHGVAGEKGTPGLFALKRFQDGSYYEDFFIDKVAETLTDYGMKGIHLADGFCPPSGGMMSDVDYSTDFVGQFLDHTGITLPENLMATMGDDSAEAEKTRAGWIYRNKRAEWIEFNAWRWEVFFKKLTTRLHAIGKEVIVLGMYCTDPFETLYCLGVDLRRIVEAGVDTISANILPASCFIAGKDDRADFFHKYMALASTTAAHLPKGHLISMLGLQDATEEWSMIHHAPTRHERDLYSMMAYHLIDGEGPSRALGGYFLCLGDGIPKEDWNWERERLEAAMTADGVEILSPVMLWSEAAYKAMLREYVQTRRWTPHKHFYEMSKAGTMCAATVTPEGLKHHRGAVLVPNFDMLPEEEKQMVLAYPGPVLCTAAPDFEPESQGICPTYQSFDRFSSYPLRIFLLNAAPSDEIKTAVEALLGVDDGTENLTGDIPNLPEHRYVLEDTLVFQKVTEGFVKAMATLLRDISDLPFESDKPTIILKQRDGAYRLYLYNDSDVKYHRAFVKSKREIREAKTVTHFPILPPRWIAQASGELHHIYKDGEKPVMRNFEIKIQPAGVTIVDLYLD